MNDTIVYSKPNCGNCEKTKNMMDELEVKYTVIDISKNRDALKKIKEMGFREAPVVDPGDGAKPWSGFNESKIREHFDTNNATEDDDTWDF